MQRRSLLAASLALAPAARALAAPPAEPFRIGLILPMTGPFASTGRQIDAAVKLWVAQNGSTVAGRKVEVLLRDDAGSPEQTKRHAQQLVVNDGVGALAGFGITPAAMAVGPIAAQGKVPAVIMAAATSSIVGTAPFYVRTSYTLPQTSATMAECTEAFVTGNAPANATRGTGTHG